MCQIRIKCAPAVQEVVAKEAMHAWGQGDIGKFFVLSTKFCYEAKTDL